MEGQIRAISRDIEGQETSDSDPYLAFCTHPNVRSFKDHIRVYTREWV